MRSAGGGRMYSSLSLSLLCPLPFFYLALMVLTVTSAVLLCPFFLRMFVCSFHLRLHFLCTLESCVPPYTPPLIPFSHRHQWSVLQSFSLSRFPLYFCFWGKGRVCSAASTHVCAGVHMCRCQIVVSSS